MFIKKTRIFIIIFTVILISEILCPAKIFPANEKLFIATTTSLDNTGFLDSLNELWKKKTDMGFEWISVGTGLALQTAKNCNVDLVIVHAPVLEKEFLSEGYGLRRKTFMRSWFIIVGPESDPAYIKGLNPVDAFRKIYKSKIKFISRGDRSGTNVKELWLWNLAGITPPFRDDWYLESGQGMLATLRIASNLGAYTLTDRPTFLKFLQLEERHSKLVELSGDKKLLINPYSAIVVNPDKCPGVKFKMAIEFINWLSSPEVIRLISSFRIKNERCFDVIK